MPPPLPLDSAWPGVPLGVGKHGRARSSCDQDVAEQHRGNVRQPGRGAWLLATRREPPDESDVLDEGDGKGYDPLTIEELLDSRTECLHDEERLDWLAVMTSLPGGRTVGRDLWPSWQAQGVCAAEGVDRELFFPERARAPTRGRDRRGQGDLCRVPVPTGLPRLRPQVPRPTPFPGWGHWPGKACGPSLVTGTNVASPPSGGLRDGAISRCGACCCPPDTPG